VWKYKPGAAAPAPVPRKTSGKRGCGRKPAKHGNKFILKSSGLRVAKKATTTIAKIAGKKMHSASAARSSTIQSLMRALDLFGSGSLTSDDETNPREPPHKHPRKFPPPKGVLKPSMMKGNFE
jgi:hypothetical protein